MKRIDLIQVEHNTKIGDVCPFIEPNVTEDSIFYTDGEPIGFYLTKMPEMMCKLADLAGAVNVIICKKFNSRGGDLHLPDYGATIGQKNNSILVYPAWRNVHGVTPIIPTHNGGYRNSLIFYPLKAFKNL